jgi:hypothetical protein
MYQYQMVPTFSKVVILDGRRWRCAVIGYSRRFVDKYLVRASIHGNYINFICDEYDRFDDNRKCLSSSLFTTGHQVVHCVPSFKVVKNPCNLGPWGHYSSIVEMSLLLDWRFKLNLPERLSLLRAMAVTPNSAYLYVAAAAALLQESSINPKHRVDYRFGLLLAHTMLDIHSSLVAERRTNPPRRFNCYSAYTVPDETHWNQECDRLLLYST